MTFLPLTIGILAAVALIALTARRLDAQGAYYDELHQATGAFAWCGRPNRYFAAVSLRGLPVMSMSYGSAIKTALFGLWLRITGRPFTIVSWRLCGLLILAAGILMFSMLAGAWLTGAALLLALLLTDKSVLLSARHDGGPVVLGLVLRLLLLGAWLRGVTPSTGEHTGWIIAMGAAAGLSIFERLHAIVLIPALAVLVAADETLLNRTDLAAATLGLGAGLLPLLWINFRSWKADGTLISASGASLQRPEWNWLPTYLAFYLSLGAGHELQKWILGQPVSIGRRSVEGILTLVMVIFCVVSLFFGDPRPAVLLGAYGACAIGTWLLPHPWTEAHHWVVGTPFQYMAFAWAAVESPPHPGTLLARFVLAALLVSRLPGIGAMERLLAAGRSSQTWSPGLTEWGRWAARQPEDTVFVAGDWGVATQAICLSNGRQVPFELFWDYRGPGQLADLVAATRIRAWCLITMDPASDVNPETARRIAADAASLPGWREQQADAETASIRGVTIRRFTRMTANL